MSKTSVIRIWSVWGVIVAGIGSLLTGVGLTGVGIAGERRENAAKASELVSEALHRRIYGLESEYAALMASALKVSPDYAPAHWHTGHVNYRNRWTDISTLVQDARLQKRLTRYEQARTKTVPTVNGYLSLANWCADNSLPLQARAHLFQVIGLAPNHVAARRRLGFVSVNGDWIETSTIWDGLYDAQQVQAAIGKWQERIAAIQKGLKRRGVKPREFAREQLTSITDPDAVYALERLANDSSKTGQLVVETLSQMPSHEVSAALLRQSVFSQWPRVREAATRQLATRPFDHYVPQLLAEMVTPIQSRFDAAIDRGQVFYRHVFFREAQYQNQVLVLDTRYRRIRPIRLVTLGSGMGNSSGDSFDDGGDSGPSFGEYVMSDLQDTIQSREQQRQLQNAWLDAMNNRICHILRTATAQQLPSKPQAWWDWWEQQTQTTQLGQKRARTKSQQETKTFVQPVYGQAPQGAPPQPRRRQECFSAGTLVVTASGMVEIERLQIGDLVLAKHPDTGELSFRPVLATTIRPPEQVINIRTTRSTIEATGGHPLWVDGEGWRMARELESGIVLHGLDRGVLIVDVKPGNTKPTYNLIVDGFHSYFVGFDRVLAHDNTPCRPTNSDVPGLRTLAN
jgi:Pretoxin HINT domain